MNDSKTWMLPARVSRRRFLGTTGAGAATLMAPRLGRGASRQRVVVVGGGFAGATAAKYLALWGGDAVDVVLIERRRQHTSCVMSNLVLNDRLRLSSLKFGYDALGSRYGVQVIKDRVDKVDVKAGLLHLRDGDDMTYDRLILAPGVAFDRVQGWQAHKVPHAWIAGGQTNLLRKQLQAMPDGGTFVMTIPKAPYRCPPGPYERACVVADLLGRRSGVIGGGAGAANAPTVVVLDANDGIQAEPETFSRAFKTLYGDIIDYRSGVALQAVDSDARVAITEEGESIAGDVLNVIPNHKAPGLLRRAGLTHGGRWAPVDPLSYESLVPGCEGIHVIGDSQATGQPKSGHMANAQAKVCSDAVLRLLAGESINSEERIANITTNSACFSPITWNQASWLTAVFAYDPRSRSMKLADQSLGEAGGWSAENYEEMFNWSDNLFADTFK